MPPNLRLCLSLVLLLASRGAAAQALTTAASPRGVDEPVLENRPPEGDDKSAGASVQEYLLAPGDSIKIQVFQSPDLALETRVSEAGTITYPLIGSVQIGGMSVSKAEALIARLLDEGGFVVKPQVSLLVTQIRGNEVSALGQFNRPGRFPLETTQTHLSDVMAEAGGIAPIGADTVILSGLRDGRPFKREIDITAMYTSKERGEDPLMQAGDVIFVQRAPQVFIYGEVQRPGMFRLERDMTVMQALAEGGGLTPRGTQRGVRVHRRGEDGRIRVIEPKLDDRLQPDDVVYVRESIF